ncbi:branched chain amino acid aminotransferase [Putridiphycobacter roseus]|uniref:branched-chain-amino-acid transaminase n=1 Tax=Putridiphycobacter roseus TaxID=2219161 RepID=A0A2W1N1N8_9FLAO|nr:branched-chain amino acid aminotransferase [Putridiphycobacter roseus]PZE17470.1 branched chain amino acid aminotransferase [Putridiphycobacter roseus]
MISTSNNIKITEIETSRISEVDFNNLPFGKHFADYMFEMDYKDGAWQQATVVPFRNLSIHPATSALHYGQAIFEGLKATKNEADEILVFRPDMNAKRFNESAIRMCMQPVPEEMFLEGMRAVLKQNSAWVPSAEGQSLYIRPFMIATDEYVGIKASDNYKFLIICSPVGAYYSEPVKVKIEMEYTRAAEGGVGRAKAAGNYAASLYPAKKGLEEGYRQLIWTDAKTHTFIEEAGTMNVIFVIDDVIITPSEEKDTILKGITKRSVLEVARDWGYKVEERPIKVDEVIDAIKSNRLTDAFGAGTAATIAPISEIGYLGVDYKLPAVETRTFSNKLKEYINEYKLGLVEDKYNWIFRV